MISPLLSKPELLAQVGRPELEGQLKEELYDLIRRESDVWRRFIQRHADVVGKERPSGSNMVSMGFRPGFGVFMVY